MAGEVQQLKGRIRSFFKDKYPGPGVIIAQPAQSQPGDEKDQHKSPRIP